MFEMGLKEYVEMARVISWGKDSPKRQDHVQINGSVMVHR